MNTINERGGFEVLKFSGDALFIAEPGAAITETVMGDVELASELDAAQIRADIDRLFSRPTDEDTVISDAPAALLGDVTTDSTEAVQKTTSQRATIKQRIKKGLDILSNDRELKLRPATEDDIADLVEVDLRAFRSVYEAYDLSDDELHSKLMADFKGRYDKLGGKWIRVVERLDKIVGFIVACPTSKKPEDFESWEVTTDNGTLESTYNPDGKYLYIVSLSTTPEASTRGGQDMLMANMIGNIISGDLTTYFESRVPGLRRWMRTQCKNNGTKFAELTEEEIAQYAQDYLTATVVINGKEQSADVELRMYQQVGCSIMKIVPNAYKDAKCMNFGALCVFNNPLPAWVRRSQTMRSVIGKAIQVVSHSSLLTSKLF